MDSPRGAKKKKKKSQMWRDARGIFSLCASCGAMRERARKPDTRAGARSLSLSLSLSTLRSGKRRVVVVFLSFYFWNSLSVIVGSS